MANGNDIDGKEQSALGGLFCNLALAFELCQRFSVAICMTIPMC